MPQIKTKNVPCKKKGCHIYQAFIFGLQQIIKKCNSCFCDGRWSLISDLQKGAQMLPHLRPLWISFPYESPFSITYSVAGNNTPYNDFTMKKNINTLWNKPAFVNNYRIILQFENSVK